MCVLWRDTCRGCKRPDLLGWAASNGFKCGACHDAMEDEEEFLSPIIETSKENSIAALAEAGFLNRNELREGAVAYSDPLNHVCTGGTGASLWRAALHLQNYLLDPKAVNRLQPGTRVCELGAGCGAAGIVLHSVGHVVTLTDLPSQVPLLEFNAAYNRSRNAASSSSLTVMPLRWGDAGHIKEVGLQPPGPPATPYPGGVGM